MNKQSTKSEKDRPHGQKIEKADLSVDIGPLTLKNPVMAASGVFGYGLELVDFCPPQKLGAIISKGLSLVPWKGNPAPRMAETAGGLLNAIGLENMGVDAFLASALGAVKKTGAVVGVNVLGRTEEDYAVLAEKLGRTEADFIELNVSCPNLASSGGASFGADPVVAARLTEKAVKRAGSKPVVVKLPPLVGDVAALAKKLEEAGATALSLINSLPGLSINLQNRQADLGHGFGGLSGPPIKPLALRQTYLTAQAVKIPVIGVGGILNHLDALEFIAAGATAVQMGVGVLIDPSSPLAVIEGLAEWLTEQNLALSELRGSLKLRA
ncbi:MAG: dihydroorotate dehydrogenase [Deltaproteobacteria bacterium]|jgi:dihydroorotate dehydrogenase (NAD+) catalytic subunit|nr:dihydroorotate dehydrogenase [Deltaproteobacteria bacterium]